VTPTGRRPFEEYLNLNYLTLGIASSGDRSRHTIAPLSVLVYAYDGVKAGVRHDDPEHAEDTAWQQ
jgi:hypothetical protein